MPLFRFSLRLWWVITKRGTPPSRRNAAESVFSEDGNGGTARSTVHSFTPHWRNGAGPKTRGGLEPRPICHRRRRARGRAFPPNRADRALRLAKERASTAERGRTWRRSARRISSGGSRTRTRTSRCYRTSSHYDASTPHRHRAPPRARRAESSAIGRRRERLRRLVHRARFTIRQLAERLRRGELHADRRARRWRTSRARRRARRGDSLRRRPGRARRGPRRDGKSRRRV